MLFYELRDESPKPGLFSGPYFLIVQLNAQIYPVNLCIQSEYAKIEKGMERVWIFKEKIETKWQWTYMLLILYR